VDALVDLADAKKLTFEMSICISLTLIRSAASVAHRLQTEHTLICIPWCTRLVARGCASPCRTHERFVCDTVRLLQRSRREGRGALFQEMIHKFSLCTLSWLACPGAGRACMQAQGSVRSHKKRTLIIAKKMNRFLRFRAIGP